MEKVKYLILGAGPAGLTFANRLKELSEDSFLVLEKEQEAGGLCRSVMVDGSPFDIGGGHFLDVRRPAVNTFLFRFMPKEEWKLFENLAFIFSYQHHALLKAFKNSVVITLVLAFIFLHEQVTYKSVIGCILIGAGTLFMVL